MSLSPTLIGGQGQQKHNSMLNDKAEQVEAGVSGDQVGAKLQMSIFNSGPSLGPMCLTPTLIGSQGQQEHNSILKWTGRAI